MDCKRTSISNKHLYVLTDIKEFIKEYKNINSEDNVNYITLKRINRVIELITSLFGEDYIILASDKSQLTNF